MVAPLIERTGLTSAWRPLLVALLLINLSSEAASTLPAEMPSPAQAPAELLER